MKRFAMGLALAVAAAPSAGQTQSQSPIGIARAVAIAERATGARAMDAELDHRRGGRLVYEVELARNRTIHEVDIDARSGKILSQRTPYIDTYRTRWFDSEEFRHIARARPLSGILQELERRTGGRVLEVSFDVEAGQAHYEIEISTRAGVTDIYLDPRTGQRLDIVYDD